MQINSGVYGIILNEKDEILLIHRTDHDLWEMPGGRWEEQETPWDAVVREVAEETGLEVGVEKLVSIGSRPSRNDLVFTFQCKITGGTMHPTPEADQIRFFSFEALPANLAPSKRERIRDAMQREKMCLLRNIEKGVTTEDYIAQNHL